MYVHVTFRIFLVLLTITKSMPMNCSKVTDGRTVCNYRSWSPPLLDSQYDYGPYLITVIGVYGSFPGQAFAGLKGARATSNAYIQLDCQMSYVFLPTNTFTSNLNWVRSLCLDQCYIRDGIAAGTLSFLTGLTYLRVYHGILGPMNADSFSGLTNLTNVFLEAKFLEKTFPAGLFAKLIAATTITIRSSSLNSIPQGAFDGLPNLVSLDLSGNLLWSLPVGAFDSLVSLMTLKLDGNNWNCGCHFTWLSRWLDYSGVNATLTCRTPAAYNGVALNRVIAALGCTTCTTCATTPTKRSINYSKEIIHNTSSMQSKVKHSYVLEATTLVFSSMALVVATLMGIALCYYRSTSKTEVPETIASGKSSNQGSTLPKQLSDNVKKTSEEMNKSRKKDVEKTGNGSDKCKCQSSVFVRQVIVSPRPLIDVEYRKMPPLFPGFHSQW